MFSRLFGGGSGSQAPAKSSKKSAKKGAKKGADGVAESLGSQPHQDSDLEACEFADTNGGAAPQGSEQDTFSSDYSDDDDDDDDGHDEFNDDSLEAEASKFKARRKDTSASQDNPLLPEEMCELPTFVHTQNCDPRLIKETRDRLRRKYLKRPESFSQQDYERMLTDDWTVSRFLLRCRLDPKRSAKLMEACGKFRLEHAMGLSQPKDFPIEFHKTGGLFRYAPDRVGNQTLYMRVKMHKRQPELSPMIKKWILCLMEECDLANGGRGTAVIFDLTQAGISNLDLGFLFWLVYSFRNYCPKGLSYIIVYNMPWMLSATARLAVSWLSATNRKRLRFVNGDAIQDFIAPENLPDFMGGTCKMDYRAVPQGARSAEDTAEENGLSREQARKLCEIFAKFIKEDGDDERPDTQDDHHEKDASDSKLKT